MIGKILNISRIEQTQASAITEAAEYIIIGLIALLIPLFFQKPQLLTGSVVNFSLAFAAIRLRGTLKNCSLVMLPALSALCGGMLFGGYTPFLVLLIPAIWAGNFILLAGIKYFSVKKERNYFITLLLAALAKAGLIFSMAFILYRFALLPEPLLAAMSIIQFATAMIGGTAAWMAHKALGYVDKN